MLVTSLRSTSSVCLLSPLVTLEPSLSVKPERSNNKQNAFMSAEELFLKTHSKRNFIFCYVSDTWLIGS